ncbi:ABC transporter permease [Thermoflavimicrobium daqui]|uniref:ABC transporter permease n=1 Tax=Thermoflavimicrobium daqui TaxID=2137476 RepID=A0A364K658_9BACL|nr:ABC transporter permease [Thermoflavimicrobium daqui]RAL25786.1 hypothetical protein DL897_06840 [Thermoflavimicrobium daqui]
MGTSKMLFIRPVTRLQILFSKYIAFLLYTLFVLVVVLFASLITAAIFTQFKQMSDIEDLLQLLTLLKIKVTGSFLINSMVFAIAVYSRNQVIPILFGLMFSGSGVIDLPIFPNTSFLISILIWLT